MTSISTGPRILPALLNFVRPSDHSTFSPSAGDRWMACSYSIQASKGIAEETSPYAEEGTLAHSYCEAVYRLVFWGMPIPADLQMKLALLPDHGVEMENCAYQYVELISSLLADKERIGEVIWYGLERGVPIFPEEGAFGTGDCIIIGTKGAIVLDFKYGKGKAVAAESVQLKIYAAGIARYLDNVPDGYRIHTVIHQPRMNPAPKETSYDMQTLYAFQKEIWYWIQESKKPGLEPVEGNHCFWCPAKRTKDVKLKCKLLLEKPVKLANENFDKFLSDMNGPIDYIGAPNTKRDEAIIKLRTLYPLIKAVYEQSEEEFKMRLMAGEAIPGVRLIETQGNRTWVHDKPDEMVKLLNEKYPQVVPMKAVPATEKLKTITEIEKEYKIKLENVTMRKISKEIDVMDGKAKEVLGTLFAFSQMINNGGSQEEL